MTAAAAMSSETLNCRKAVVLIGGSEIGSPPRSVLRALFGASGDRRFSDFFDTPAFFHDDRGLSNVPHGPAPVR
jgi:hypothetical protein